MVGLLREQGLLDDPVAAAAPRPSLGRSPGRSTRRRSRRCGGGRRRPGGRGRGWWARTMPVALTTAPRRGVSLRSRPSQRSSSPATRGSSRTRSTGGRADRPVFEEVTGSRPAGQGPGEPGPGARILDTLAGGKPPGGRSSPCARGRGPLSFRCAGEQPTRGGTRMADAGRRPNVLPAALVTILLWMCGCGSMPAEGPVQPDRGAGEVTFADPRETWGLAADPAHAEEVRRLQGLLMVPSKGWGTSAACGSSEEPSEAPATLGGASWRGVFQVWSQQLMDVLLVQVQRLGTPHRNVASSDTEIVP